METQNIPFIEQIWLYYSLYRGKELYRKWIVPTLWMTLVETKMVPKWKPKIFLLQNKYGYTIHYTEEKNYIENGQFQLYG